MTDVEAYERALGMWGDAAAAWKVAADRFIVGRWVQLAELRGESSGRVVLASAAKGLEVCGDGETWEAAFDVATRAMTVRA